MKSLCFCSFFTFLQSIFAAEMKTLTFIITICLLLPANILDPGLSFKIKSPAGGEDSLTVMFWNLENFFDWKPDSLSESSSDKEFSSFGKKHWTRGRFKAKCSAVAKSVFWVKEQEGRLPDVIGLAEVENRYVLEKLLDWTPLYKEDYRIVHFDSPDPRGIDVALLYRSSRLELLEEKPFGVVDRNGARMLTRDILLARFRRMDGDSIAFLVNHHPSKYGGKTGRRREAALESLRALADSLAGAGCRNIVAMGDFNDTPENPAFGILTDRREGERTYSSAFVNLASELAGRGEGTIRYSGIWELIDMFFVSGNMLAGGRVPQMKVLRIPFLTVRDSAHSGEKPLRTYSGPRYLGGVSDHCPILLKIP